MRGFLLTLDALFALSIVVAGLSFFAVQAFSEVPAASFLYLAGRDFLLLPSGLQAELSSALEARGFRISSEPQDARLVVQAKAFRFSRVCQGAVVSNAACLRGPDAALSPIESVAWVGVR